MSTGILQSLRLPGRLDEEQAAELLGFKRHDIPVLIRAKLLKVLGRPNANAPKYFSSLVVEKCAQDPERLDKMTRAVSSNWQRKNLRRGNGVATMI